MFGQPWYWPVRQALQSGREQGMPFSRATLSPVCTCQQRAIIAVEKGSQDVPTCKPSTSSPILIITPALSCPSPRSVVTTLSPMLPCFQK